MFLLSPLLWLELVVTMLQNGPRGVRNVIAFALICKATKYLKSLAPPAMSEEMWNVILNESWHQLRLEMGEKKCCKRRSRLTDASEMSHTEEEIVEEQEVDVIMVSDDE